MNDRPVNAAQYSYFADSKQLFDYIALAQVLNWLI
jgi:hypothetical protein